MDNKKIQIQPYNSFKTDMGDNAGEHEVQSRYSMYKQSMKELDELLEELDKLETKS